MKLIYLFVPIAAVAFCFSLACKSNSTNTTSTNTTQNNAAPPPQNQSPQQVQAQSTPVSAPSVIARAEPAPTINSLPSDKTFSDLMMLYSKLFTARMKNDKTTVASLLPDDYAETTGDGKVLNKAQVLATIKAGEKVDTFSLADMKSNEAGDKSSMTGRASVTRKGKKETWQFVATYRKEQGSWVVTSTKISDYKKQ